MIQKLRKYLLCALFLAGAVASVSALPRYRFHAMPETSYYGGIHSIAKDSVGRIWFSGYDALFMYNGSAFSRMNEEVTRLLPKSSWAYGQVVTDKQRRLYLGTNHGLLRFNYRKQCFESVLDGNIGTIRADADGRLWLIRDGRIESVNPDRLSQVTTYPLPADLASLNQSVALICADACIYVGVGGRLLRLNPETGVYTRFSVLEQGNTVIRDVVEYSGSVYVLTHMDGLYECDSEGRVVDYFRLPIEYEKSAGAKELYLDPTGVIWVATQSGLLLLDPQTRQTRLLRANLHDRYSLPNNSVWSIFADPDGGVWVGTYGGKLAYMRLADSDVNFFKAVPGGLNHPIVSCFEEDANGNLWIGTEGGGITYWNRKTDQFAYYTQENRSGILSNMIKKMSFDGDHTLLVSAFNGGIKAFDVSQGRFSDLKINTLRSSQSLSVYDFIQEGDAGIWLTDPDVSLMYEDLRTGSVERVHLLNEQGDSIRMHIETLYHDRRGNLCLVTHDGMYVVDVKTKRILAHHYIADAPYAVNNLCSYCVTSDDAVWFGTRGGGVNRLDSRGNYTNFKDKNDFGLSGKTVFGILEESSSRNVWFSTNDGLYYYDRSLDVIRKSQIDISNPCGAYYVRACYKTAAGEMLFGGTDGFILFTPEKICYNEQKPKVFFTDLLINNLSAIPNAKKSPLKRAISTLSGCADDHSVIRLSYKQSNIEICFSTNSYLDADQNQFAYRMTGLSDSWSLLPPGQQAVQFLNLPAGKYRFEIKAANNDGLWGDEVSTLHFEVSPSPFLSAWAYWIYAILLLSILYLIWRYFTNKKLFEHQLKLEKLKEQNMQELTRARINFFTNISHDLKTPLTLVLDPLKQLKNTLSEDSASKPYVHLIEKNVGHIQRTISQLLQFREIESQKITLNLQPGDLIRFIDSIFSLFEFYANKKGIEMDFQTQYESFYTRFDHDVIEKIFTNFFSNAIKYTTDNGYVGVRINRATPAQLAELPLAATDTDADYLAIMITNTGAEIPEDKRESIFESFNRLSTRRSEFDGSTGLGLAIVKELVGNLKGAINLCSGDGKVSFTVVLPFTRDTERIDDVEVSYDYTISEIDNLLTESDVSEPADKHSRKTCDIVVVEDDPNLRNYLEQRLLKYYNVYTAANGNEGIAKVEKISPQMVITDLMMPEADGFDLCRCLRSNLKTSHIPVIVLSGLGKSGDNKIKALECGANVFIDKPFDMDFLLQQIANLIKTQNEFKELYSKKYIAEPSRITITSMDEELLRKAMDCIEQNIGNTDYNVDSFVSDMLIGRTLLYQKINDITGMSIKEFILDIRLKRAAQLLKESDLTIAEISMMAGFANPKYFSICFKRHFELTPSEFKRKNGKE